MKIRVVSSKEEIETLNPNEEIIHIAFRPSSTDILSLVQKCPQFKALQIPTSYKRTISNSTLMFLKMHGIEVLEGDVGGHRKDINEYTEVSHSVYDRIKEYRANGMIEQDIIEKLVGETGLSLDFIEFLVKNK